MGRSNTLIGPSFIYRNLNGCLYLHRLEENNTPGIVAVTEIHAFDYDPIFQQDVTGSNT